MYFKEFNLFFFLFFFIWQGGLASEKIFASSCWVLVRVYRSMATFPTPYSTMIQKVEAAPLYVKKLKNSRAEKNPLMNNPRQ